jgi:Domain of unknown function (DUF4328)
VTTPSWPPPTPRPPRPAAGSGYRSPVLIACLVVAACAVGLLVVGATIVAAIVQAALANEALAEPGSIAPERLAFIDARRTALSRAVLLVDLVGIGLLALWTRRLYRNLRPLGAGDLRFSDGWALGGWFVPFLNLVRPKQIVDDIWRASDPMRRPTEVWDQRPLSDLLHCWWFVWVVLCLPTLLLGFPAETAEDAEIAGAFVAGCGAVQLLFGVLTIFVIVRTTSRQVRIATGDPVEPAEQLHRGRCICNFALDAADSGNSGACLRPIHPQPAREGLTMEDR